MATKKRAHAISAVPFTPARAKRIVGSAYQVDRQVNEFKNGIVCNIVGNIADCRHNEQNK